MEIKGTNEALTNKSVRWRQDTEYHLTILRVACVLRNFNMKL